MDRTGLSVFSVRPSIFEENGVPDTVVIDRSGLRKWMLLSHLTDEELEDVEFAIVYGTERYAKEGLSALFVTKGNYEVYGTGYNNMLQFSEQVVPFEEVQYGQTEVTEYLGSHVRVDGLCGLGIRKIVVGDLFGAALSVTNELYVWGELDMTVKAPELIVTFERYVPGTKCSKCGQEYHLGGAVDSQCMNCAYGIAHCHECNWVPVYKPFTQPAPPLNTPLLKFICSANVLFPCLRCGRKCSSKLFNMQHINYCESCDLLREVSWRDTPTRKQLGPRRVRLPPEVQVVDIESGRSFLVMTTTSGRLLIWGSLGKNHYKGYVDNPDNIVIKSVSCGASHVATMSTCGKVYTFGCGNHGQLGYPWKESFGLITMRAVPLPKRVVKVCCRRNGTVTLMEDGTIAVFGNFIAYPARSTRRHRVFPRGPSDSPRTRRPVRLYGRFTDIACSHLTNYFVAQSAPLVFTWRHHVPRRQGGQKHRECPTDYADALAGFPLSFTTKSSLSNSETLQVSSPTAEMYGKSLLSDLKLKLSDGLFPVHTFVLYTHSTYFKRVFEETDVIPKVIDLTIYNPRAYKSLIKYFYRVPAESDLTCDDLFDLHAIAVNYGESEVAVDVLHRLKKAITAFNAPRYIERAKQSGLIVIIDECYKLMEHPIIPEDLNAEGGWVIW